MINKQSIFKKSSPFPNLEKRIIIIKICLSTTEENDIDRESYNTKFIKRKYQVGRSQRNIGDFDGVNDDKHLMLHTTKRTHL